MICNYCNDDGEPCPRCHGTGVDPHPPPFPWLPGVVIAFLVCLFFLILVSGR